MIRCDEGIALETLPSRFPYSGNFALSCKTNSLLMITNHFVSSLYFWECVDQSYFTPSACYQFFYSSCLFYIKIYCKLTNSSFGNRWLFLKLFPNKQFVNVKLIYRRRSWKKRDLFFSSRAPKAVLFGCPMWNHCKS